MPVYETVVFDLDGTLLNTIEDLHLSTNAALAAHGMPQHTLDDVRRFVGNGIRKLIERAVPAGTSAAKQDAVYEDFCAHYAAHCEGDFAVQELIARQFPGAFDAVLGENEAAGIRKKPAPDMVEAALERMGATRDSLVYIGDSEVDVQTAANVGCPCVSCTWGFRSVDELLAAGATTFVDTPDELERVLLGTAR